MFKNSLSLLRSVEGSYKTKNFSQIFRIFKIISACFVIIYIPYKFLDLLTFPEPQFHQSQGDKKVLILSMHCAGGHKTASDAVQAFLKEKGYAADVYYVDNPNHVNCKIYETIISNQILRKYVYKFIIMLGNVYLQRKQIERHMPHLNKILANNKYECIVSVILQAPAIMDELQTKAPMLQFPTDLSLFDISLNSKKANYLAVSEKCMNQMIEKGIARDKIFKVTGTPLHPKFITEVKTKAERKMELNLPKNQDAVLVMSGSCGSDDMIRIMKKAHNSSKYFVFVCGKNKLLYKRLTNLNNRKYGQKFRVLGFIKNAHCYMQASDILIGKPGGATTSEMIAAKLPVIMLKNSVLIQEEYNSEFIIKNNLGTSVANVNQITDHLIDYVSNTAKNNRVFNHFHNDQMEKMFEVIQKMSHSKPTNCLKNV